MRCSVCRRKGHTNRAHSNLTGPELAALKADGLEYLARGFRELGEPTPDGDLLDVLRADTERSQLAEVKGAIRDKVAEAFPGVPVDVPDGTVMPGGWVVERIAAAERTPPALVGPEPNYTEFAIGESGQMMVLAANPGGWAPKWSYVGEQGPQIVPWRTVLGPDGPLLITLPGVFDLTAEQYHDPAVTGDWLSNSDARQLIDPGCPAQFRYDRDNGVRKTSVAFSMGHAVHARILGKGETIAVRPAEFDSWRTKASQAWRTEQERAGRSVILPEDAEVVEAMAAAVHMKPDAHRLLSQSGRPEMALFWIDPETGVRRRALVDYLPDVVDQYGVMEPVDIKSADSVAPNDDMERKLYHHAWHRQGTTIADGIIALGLAREVVFNFIVQSKTAPHLVTIVRLDADAERIGRIENRQALMVYKECLETDQWPDYAPDPVTLSVPPWIARAYEEDVH
jgi:hypothetical protein